MTSQYPLADRKLSLCRKALLCTVVSQRDNIVESESISPDAHDPKLRIIVSLNLLGTDIQMHLCLFHRNTI